MSRISANNSYDKLAAKWLVLFVLGWVLLTVWIDSNTIKNHPPNRKPDLEITKYQISTDDKGNAILILQLRNTKTDKKVIGITYVFPNIESF